MINYKAKSYKGNTVGNTSYNYRLGVQIVATDSTTGKRRAVFTTSRGGKTPCLKTWEGIAHYKSGLNKADGKRFQEAMAEAQKLANEYNTTQPHK